MTTVFGDITNNICITRGDIFGSVAILIPSKDEDGVLRVIRDNNDSSPATYG
ncbi:MAG: hypothetical protein JKX67_05180 [Colwellia sp.]|nr:hypothetical protein [Colwellia sp.]